MYPIKVENLHRIFNLLDKNGDGVVSIDELMWLLERIGVDTCKDQLLVLMGKSDLDYIDFLLFYDVMIKRNNDDVVSGSNIRGQEEEEKESTIEKDLRKAFDVFDLNGDGFISSEELQDALSKLGLRENNNCAEDYNYMIKAYDTNLDGLLDFEEFKNMMLVM